MKRRNKIALPILLVLLVSVVAVSLNSIIHTQKYGKLINYAGIVRGGSQRVFKLETNHRESDELIGYVDGIIQELLTGKGQYGLPKLQDDTYNQNLTKLSEQWDVMKEEIAEVRQGKDTKTLLDKSEVFFVLANETVFAAEAYANKQTKLLLTLIVIMSGTVIITWSTISLLYLRRLFHLEQNNDNLQVIAYKDELTGADNLDKFHMDAAAFMKKHKDYHYAVFYMDFENFKYCNDVFGYAYGDILLKKYADLIQTDLQLAETFGRVSGDRFVILRHYKNKNELLDRQQAVDQQLKKFALHGEQKYKMSIFGGICCVEDTAEQLEVSGLVDRANFAQKTVKGREKSYAFYDESIRNQMIEEMTMRERLQTALKNKAFCVYLQPKVSLTTDKIEGAEALVRWVEEDGTLISPDAFIPMLEKQFLISELDQYVFEEVCIWFSRQMQKKKALVPISVNVSGIQFHNPNFVSIYAGIKEKYNIPEGLLEIEFTETMGIANISNITEIIAKLHQRGFICAMDDFGRGYSSLSALKDMNVDVLKLDASFFKTSGDVEKEKILIQGILMLAKKLQMRTVAEGIELNEQVQFLRELGCDMVQGYVYYKPMPMEDFQKLWK